MTRKYESPGLTGGFLYIGRITFADHPWKKNILTRLIK